MSEFVRLDFESHLVRAMEHNGEVYFSLPDVREAVGVVCRHPVGIHLDDAEREFFLIDTPYDQERHPVVNTTGSCTVAALGVPAIGVRFIKWVLADAKPFVLAPRSAAFIPRKSRAFLYSTTEIAAALGVHPNTLGKLARHLKTEANGELHMAIGHGSEAVANQWLWTYEGRAAILEEFGDYRQNAANAA